MNPEFQKRIKSIAEYLGYDKVSGVHIDNESVIYKGEESIQLVENYKGDKLDISAYVKDKDYLTYNDNKEVKTHFNITVSASKSDLTIARDIEKRILVDYRKAIATVKVRMKEHQDLEDIAKEELESVVALLPISCRKLNTQHGNQNKPSYQFARFTNYGDSNKKIRIEGQRNFDSFELRISSLTVEQAKHIITFLEKE